METKAPFSAAEPVMATAGADPLWFKDAVIYQLHVKAFADSNGDGIGDFQGLTDKLDYIKALGVNTLWLLPFYPSPLRDDGYDVADYHNVLPAYGTRGDFRRFVREAHRLGLRVITELIVNHTSDQHPWFQAARRAPPGSNKRDYYVWSDDPKKYAGTRIIFTDSETSNWTWDEVAQSYYWHRFFSHQPDLNFDNPQVLKAMLRTMRFWLDMGVDGFRLDAIPYLVEREGTSNENLPETHTVIKQIRAALDKNYTGRVLLAEANQWPEDVSQYFGDSDECHMAYHFPLMPRLFMSIAREDRFPLVEILMQTPQIPADCQWAIFLRNHDELTLEMVTDRERDYMYQVYANDPRMRINVGIRRRLAPLMGNDRGQIELISFLLMTMPGSPILYYGDEIGMGDNLYLGDRDGVRTPMQWSPDRNAGFSRVDPQRLYLPPVMDPVYGYQAVNVEAQLRSNSSLLHWTRRMIAVRAAHRAFGRGTLTFLEPGNRKILAYLREYEGESLLCVANLSRLPQSVELDLSKFDQRVPVEIMGNVSFPPVGKLPYMLTLAGHGYFAFRLATDAPPPAWHEERLANRPLPVLVLAADWRSVLGLDTTRDIRRLVLNTTEQRMRDEVLLPYLRVRRWFAAKGQTIKEVTLRGMTEWNSADGNWLLSLLTVDVEGDTPQLYFLPLAIEWEARDNDPMEKFGASTLSKVRQKDRVGAFYEAFANPQFARALARGMGQNSEIRFGRGRIRFTATSAYGELAPAIDEEVRIPPLEQSNTGLILGTRLYLKGYRRLQRGISPELEIGRFLTDASPYPNIAPVAGTAEYITENGEETYALAVLHKFMENQGDTWTYTLDYLKRTFNLPAQAESALVQPASLVSTAAATTPQPAAEPTASPHAAYVAQMALLAQRIGELHHAFARVTGDPAFDPEQVTGEELEGWKRGVLADAGHAFTALQQLQLTGEAQARAAELLGAREQVSAMIEGVRCETDGLMKTRHHADLHLGQVLLAKNDFLIIDFEGEPSRSVEERRRKHSPLRDVAGMVRSFSYAAHAAMISITTEPVAQAKAAAGLRAWEAEVVTAFLDSYRATAEGLASVPADAAALRELLRLFVLEKAIYELRYEMANRPDWVILPLNGILEILRA